MYCIKAIHKEKGSIVLEKIESSSNAEGLLRGLVHEGFEVTIKEELVDFKSYAQGANACMPTLDPRD